MIKIPFTVFDFFGYLAHGFIIIIAVDYAFFGNILIRSDITIIFGIYLILIAYVIGQIVANISAYIYERYLVNKLLGAPEIILLRKNKIKGMKKLFPGYYDSIPQQISSMILKKAKAKAGIDSPGKALFLHCFYSVKSDPVTLERLHAFLNLYGFCRNISMASLIVIFILLFKMIMNMFRCIENDFSSIMWLCFAFLTAIGMFYRYLKFYRIYANEVYNSYLEAVRRH